MKISQILFLTISLIPFSSHAMLEDEDANTKYTGTALLNTESEASFSGSHTLLRGAMSVNPHGHLEIGGVDMVMLANSSQYPIYVMDEALVRKNMHDYVTSIGKYYNNPGEVFYASKALMNLGLCKLAQAEGMGLDVSTGGELYTAIQAEFPMNKVIMHGNNKSEEEVERIPVPGMVLVKNGGLDWIVRPQTLEDILRNDVKK